jgi:hypothetical protein
VSYRPLVFVIGLTLGDYVLWKWSLNGHDVISEIAGLTLPVLGAACLWLLVVNGMRLLAHHTSAPVRRARRRPRGSQQAAAGAAVGAHTAASGTRKRDRAAGTSQDKLAA